jgi:hypothetical protein
MNDEQLSQLYRRHAARAQASSEHVSLEALLAIVEGPASAVDRNATLDHVMACTHCQAELELLRAVVNGTADAATTADTSGVTHPTQQRRLSRWRPSPALAAAALLVILLGGALWRSLSRNDVPITRGRDGAAILVGPSGNVRPPITLTWHSTPNLLEYRVEIVDENGAPVYSTATRDTVSAVPAGLIASGRTYRWWITSVARDGARVTAEPLTFTTR